MKPWQIPLFCCLCATAFCIGWWQGLVYGAPSAPSQAPYRATVILPAQTISCAGSASALTFERAAITLDCSADRLFENGFQITN